VQIVELQKWEEENALEVEGIGKAMRKGDEKERE
jgi:hypothetical protein